MEFLGINGRTKLRKFGVVETGDEEGFDAGHGLAIPDGLVREKRRCHEFAPSPV